MAKGLRLTEEQYLELARRQRESAGVREAGQSTTVGPNLNPNAAPASKRSGSRQISDRAVRAANGEIEAMFELQVLDAGLKYAPKFQFKALPERKFRIDVAFLLWPREPDVAFEVQGHVHRIRHQFLRDMDRHNLLTEYGWRIYYVSGDMVRDGSGIALVKRIIGSIAQTGEQPSSLAADAGAIPAGASKKP